MTHAAKAKAVPKAMASPIKYPGGKFYLAGRFAQLEPAKYTTFVEVYGGSAAMLLAKQRPGRAEILNDLCSQLQNFWAVLQDPQQSTELIRRLTVTPFSQADFNRAKDLVEIERFPDVLQAARFFVRVRQSRAGDQRGFATTTKSRVRRGMQEQVSAWLNAVDGLAPVCERLRTVLLRHERGIPLIRELDHKGTFFYLDPPYPDESITSDSGHYRLGMPTEPDPQQPNLDSHRELLEVLTSPQFKSQVMLSSYDNALYSRILKKAGWQRLTFDVPNQIAGTKAKGRKTEVVWLNYVPPE